MTTNLQTISAEIAVSFPVHGKFFSAPVVANYGAWKIRLDPIYKGMADLDWGGRGTVLDLGCGWGLSTQLLARIEPRLEVIGIDHDARKVEIAGRAATEVENCRFRHGDITVLEAGEPVSGILLIDVLHYWPSERQRDILTRAAAALQPGGRLLFRDGMREPGGGHFLVRLGEAISTRIGWNRGGAGLFFQPRDFYLSQFEAFGLEILEERSDLGRGSNIAFWLKKK